MFARRLLNSFLAVALCVALSPAPALAWPTVTTSAPSATPLRLAPSAPSVGSVPRDSAEPTASAGVIYRVKPGTTPDQVAARHGLGKSKRLDSRAPQVATLGVPEGGSTQQVVAKLQSDQAVVYASPNYIRHVTAYSTNPNDTYFRDTTAFTIGGVAAPYTPMHSWWLRSQGLNITTVWGALGSTITNYGPRSDGSAFKVAVIDTGFYLTHEDKGANIVGGKDEFATYSSATDVYTTDNDVTPVDPSAPLNDVITASHGTCVSGEIAAATDNSLGVASAGWDAQVRAYKVQGIWIEGDGTSVYPPNCAVIFDGAIISALYDATNDGCKIINMSLGGGSNSTALQDAIDYAYGHGVIVVAAAGNDNSSVPSYPGADNHVLSVGSMGLSGTPASPIKRRSSFSNYGPTLDVVGPGEYVWGLVRPGYDADGSGLVYFPGYYWWQGTSMASPAVAGSIAALWRFQPTFTADEMVSYVENTASGGGTRNDNLGYGYVDANAVYQRMKSNYPALPVPSVTGLPASGSFVKQTAFTAAWPLQSGYQVAYTSTLDGSSVPVSVAANASAAYAGLTDGSHTVVIKSSSLRNWYDPNGFSTSFTVDTVAPVFSTPAYDAATKLLSWSVTEANGFASQAVAIKNMSTGVTTTTTVAPAIRTFAVSGLSQADYQVTVSGTDTAGNTGQSATGSWSTIPPPDTTAPQTTISALPSGWTKSDVTFSLTASDTDSPLGISTYYGLNAPAVTPYMTPVTISAEGTTTISYFSVDASSNVEATNTATVRIDKTPPTIAGAPTTLPNAAGWYRNPVTAHFNASDALSGLAGVPQDVVLASQGASQTVLGSATDVAGNAAIGAVSNLNIDLTAPSTTDDHVASYTASATVHLSANDAPSGVATTTWALDGFLGSGTTVSTSALGIHTLTYGSTDVAGNVEGTHTITFTVTVTDQAAPITTISALPSGWSKNDVVFSLTTFDADTPIGISTYYGLNASAVTPYVLPVTVSTDGTTTISYFSVDALGNTEAPKSAQVRVDKSAPLTTDDHVTTYTANAVVHLTPSDAYSGVASTNWMLDGTPGSGTAVSTSALGGHTLAYGSTDIAGNVEDTHTITFTVIPTPKPLPVYRFYNKKNGSHFYTASETEKANVLVNLSATYSYDGVAYAVNTANPDNGSPLYRFYNKKNGSHFYTASETEKANVLRTLSATYSYDGPAYNVCLAPASGATAVWRFYDNKNGSHFYTADAAEKSRVLATLSSTYSLDGAAFYLAP